MATIYQVSELAGVSLATVSRVMNKNTKVSDKTTKKVLDAMQTSGYKPNPISQSIAAYCTYSEVMLVPVLYDACFAEIMAGLERAPRAAGNPLFLENAHSEQIKENAVQRN